MVPAAGSGSRFGQATPSNTPCWPASRCWRTPWPCCVPEPRIDQGWVVISPDDDWFEPFGFAQQAWAQSKLRVLRQGGATRARERAQRPGRAGRPARRLGAGARRRALLPAGRSAGPADRRAGRRPRWRAVGLPVADTLKRQDNDSRVAATVPRDGLWQAQTRRCSATACCRRRWQSAAAPTSPTRHPPSSAWAFAPLVRGDASNFKVTYAQDIRLAAAHC